MKLNVPSTRPSIHKLLSGTGFEYGTGCGSMPAAHMPCQAHFKLHLHLPWSLIHQSTQANFRANSTGQRHIFLFRVVLGEMKAGEYVGHTIHVLVP